MATEKYKVLEDVTVNGVFHQAGSETMLLEEEIVGFEDKFEKVTPGETQVGEKSEAPKEEEKAADESDEDEDDEEDSDEEEK